MQIRKLVKLKFYFPFIESLFCFLGIISVTFGFMMFIQTFYQQYLPTLTLCPIILIWDNQ